MWPLILIIFAFVVAVLCDVFSICKIESWNANVKGGTETMQSVLTRNLPEELRGTYGELFGAGVVKKDVAPVVTFDDIGNRMPYAKASGLPKSAPHIGQRKLFLSELQFLTNYEDVSNVVVYAGAAPSNHTGFLSDLFPKVKFVLVDPNPFDVFRAEPVYLKADCESMGDDELRGKLEEVKSSRSLIFIINDLFTKQLARLVKEVFGPVLFISDIRTNSSDDKEPDSVDILWNDAQQYNWISLMKPAMAMLKFRHPFYEDWDSFDDKVKGGIRKDDFDEAEIAIKFLDNYKTKKLVYYDGVINIQAWAGWASTETRLVTNCEKVKDYGDPTEYEDKFFYYNSIERGFVHHKNDNANKALGFDHCNDCSLENLLWKNYRAKHPQAPSVVSLVRSLSNITKRSLIRGSHGKFFAPHTYSSVATIVKTYEEERKKMAGKPRFVVKAKK